MEEVPLAVEKHLWDNSDTNIWVWKAGVSQTHDNRLWWCRHEALMVWLKPVILQHKNHFPYAEGAHVTTETVTKEASENGWGSNAPVDSHWFTAWERERGSKTVRAMWAEVRLSVSRFTSSSLNKHSDSLAHSQTPSYRQVCASTQVRWCWSTIAVTVIFNMDYIPTYFAIILLSLIETCCFSMVRISSNTVL